MLLSGFASDSDPPARSSAANCSGNQYPAALRIASCDGKYPSGQNLFKARPSSVSGNALIYRLPRYALAARFHRSPRRKSRTTFWANNVGKRSVGRMAAWRNASRLARDFKLCAQEFVQRKSGTVRANRHLGGTRRPHGVDGILRRLGFARLPASKRGPMPACGTEDNGQRQFTDTLSLDDETDYVTAILDDILVQGRTIDRGGAQGRITRRIGAMRAHADGQRLQRQRRFRRHEREVVDPQVIASRTKIRLVRSRPTCHH